MSCSVRVRPVSVLLCLTVVACGGQGERVLTEEETREAAALYRDSVLDLTVAYAPLDGIGDPAPGGGVGGLGQYLEAADDTALAGELLVLCEVLDHGSAAAARAAWEADANRRFGLSGSEASIFSLIPVVATVLVCPEHGERVLEYAEQFTG